MLTLERYRLSRPKMLYLMDKLKDNAPEIASLYIPPGYSEKTIQGLLATILEPPDAEHPADAGNRADMPPRNAAMQKAGGLSSVPPEAVQALQSSPTGGVLFWGNKQRYLALPPFPVREERNSPTCEIEPLRAILNREFLLALILVRLGSFAIGVFRGHELISSKAGTGNVHARHRQGGSSSHRFERHREKQMETFFTRVGLHTIEQLEPYARQLEWVIYGGTRETLLDFRKQCHYTQQFDSRTLDLLLNIREPKQEGLQEAIREAWSSRVLQWVEKTEG